MFHRSERTSPLCPVSSWSRLVLKAHNSLGPGERYHEPLRRIYQKIRYSEPGINIQLALLLAVNLTARSNASLALKAINDTMNPEGLVPSLLVFGVLPRFPPFNTELPGQAPPVLVTQCPPDRMRALQMARAEMETISAELSLQRALVS